MFKMLVDNRISRSVNNDLSILKIRMIQARNKESTEASAETRFRRARTMAFDIENAIIANHEKQSYGYLLAEFQEQGWDTHFPATYAAIQNYEELIINNRLGEFKPNEEWEISSDLIMLSSMLSYVYVQSGLKNRAGLVKVLGDLTGYGEDAISERSLEMTGARHKEFFEGKTRITPGDYENFLQCYPALNDPKAPVLIGLAELLKSKVFSENDLTIVVPHIYPSEIEHIQSIQTEILREKVEAFSNGYVDYERIGETETGRLTVAFDYFAIPEQHLDERYIGVTQGNAYENTIETALTGKPSNRVDRDGMCSCCKQTASQDDLLYHFVGIQEGDERYAIKESCLTKHFSPNNVNKMAMLNYTLRGIRALSDGMASFLEFHQYTQAPVSKSEQELEQPLSATPYSGDTLLIEGTEIALYDESTESYYFAHIREDYTRPLALTNKPIKIVTSITRGFEEKQISPDTIFYIHSLPTQHAIRLNADYYQDHLDQKGLARYKQFFTNAAIRNMSIGEPEGSASNRLYLFLDDPEGNESVLKIGVHSAMTLEQASQHFASHRGVRKALIPHHMMRDNIGEFKEIQNFHQMAVGLESGLYYDKLEIGNITGSGVDIDLTVSHVKTMAGITRHDAACQIYNVIGDANDVTPSIEWCYRKFKDKLLVGFSGMTGKILNEGPVNEFDDSIELYEILINNKRTITDPVVLNKRVASNANFLKKHRVNQERAFELFKSEVTKISPDITFNHDYDASVSNYDLTFSVESADKARSIPIVVRLDNVFAFSSVSSATNRSNFRSGYTGIINSNFTDTPANQFLKFDTDFQTISTRFYRLYSNLSNHVHQLLQHHQNSFLNDSGRFSPINIVPFGNEFGPSKSRLIDKTFVANSQNAGQLPVKYVVQSAQYGGLNVRIEGEGFQTLKTTAVELFEKAKTYEQGFDALMYEYASLHGIEPAFGIPAFTAKPRPGFVETFNEASYELSTDEGQTILKSSLRELYRHAIDLSMSGIAVSEKDRYLVAALVRTGNYSHYLAAVEGMAIQDDINLSDDNAEADFEFFKPETKTEEKNRGDEIDVSPNGGGGTGTPGELQQGAASGDPRGKVDSPDGNSFVEEATNIQPLDTAPPAAPVGSDLHRSPPAGNDTQPVDAGQFGGGDQSDRSGVVDRGIDRAAGSGNQGSTGEPRSTPDAGGEATDSGHTTPLPTDVVVSGELVSEDFSLDDVDLGLGGEISKARRNIEAIKLAKSLIESGLLATKAEKEVLAQYVGWGGIKGIFDERKERFDTLREELKSIITEKEYADARGSILNAHYTSKTVVNSTYRALSQLGFTGGNMLEPAVGSGNFIGLMPGKMLSESRLHAVELDSVTAQIFKATYPFVNTLAGEGFEAYPVVKDHIDLVIGNPPFGDYPVFDAELPPYSGMSIHNYFFCKSIDLLRDGGMMAMVVSHYFMDAKNSKARNFVALDAYLVGAVRLPNNAFKANAGTEVVTDILIFQKNSQKQQIELEKRAQAEEAGEDYVDPDYWVSVKEQPIPIWNDELEQDVPMTLTVNPYFLNNPENVLGRHSTEGTMYRANSYTVTPFEHESLEDGLKRWESRLPKDIYLQRTAQQDETLASYEDAWTGLDSEVPDNIRSLNFYIKDNQLFFAREFSKKLYGEPVTVNPTAFKRLSGMIGVRDALNELIKLESSQDSTDWALAKGRATLNKVYDTFLKKFGYINDAGNRRLMYRDISFSLISSLEKHYQPAVSEAKALERNVSPMPASAKKADIFDRRVVFPALSVESVESAQDAYFISLNRYGRVNFQYMLSLYPVSEETLLRELKGIIIRASEDEDDYVPVEEYCSGDVKTKLEIAKSLARVNADFYDNVSVLEKVIPADKTPSQITANIGAPFIDKKFYKAFLRELMEINAEVSGTLGSGHWKVRITGATSTKSRLVFGTPRIEGHKIFEHLLLGKPVVIMDDIPDGTSSKRVVNVKATEAANEKLGLIKEEWKNWIWGDSERAFSIAGAFNDQLNRYAPRVWDGSHLDLRGATGMRPTQMNGIWRGLCSKVHFVAHAVGSGKTRIMCATTFLRKRMGLSNKSLIVVPNHLPLQTRDEYLELYPTANLLVATPDDFKKENRRLLFAKIITGDWDAIIVGHSQLMSLAVDSEFEKQFYEKSIDDIVDEIRQTKEENGDRVVLSKLENTKKKLEKKFRERANEVKQRKDDFVDLTMLGIDNIVVDEFHEFKNLYYTSNSRGVAGMGNPNGSQKAFDIFLKFRWLLPSKPNASIQLLTATSVANSLVEVYTLQRYSDYDGLEQAGILSFNNWLKTFGRVESVYEVSSSGVGYRETTRLTGFNNLKVLRNMMDSYYEYLSIEDVKNAALAAGQVVKVPKMKSGGPINVVIPRNKAQAALMGTPELKFDDNKELLFEAPVTEIEVEKVPDAEQYKLYYFDGDKRVVLQETFDTEYEARIHYVEKAITAQTHLDPKSILGRFSRLAQLTKESDGKINALSLTSLANKLALDIRCVNPNAEPEGLTKVSVMADMIFERYKKWNEDLGVQIVFCDTSTPKPKLTSYESTTKYGFVISMKNGLSPKKLNLYQIMLKDIDESYAEEEIAAIAAGEVDYIPPVMPFLVDVKKERTSEDGNQYVVEIYEPNTGQLLHSVVTHDKRVKSAVYKAIRQSSAHLTAMDTLDEYPLITEQDIDSYFSDSTVHTSDEIDYFTPDEFGGDINVSFSFYENARTSLVEKGIKPHEIAFIHDYDTPLKKADLFARCRSGEIRVIMASTPKLGTGSNIQDRLVALYNVDVCWRPDQFIQRIGRIVRQGNKLFLKYGDTFEVEVFNLATAQTYDSRRYQILEHKIKAIDEFNTGAGGDTLEFDSGEAATYADMKAASSGDPMILAEIKLKDQIKSLRIEKDTFLETRNNAKWVVGKKQNELDRIPEERKFHAENKSKLISYEEDMAAKGFATESIEEEEARVLRGRRAIVEDTEMGSVNRPGGLFEGLDEVNDSDPETGQMEDDNKRKKEKKEKPPYCQINGKPYTKASDAVKFIYSQLLRASGKHKVDCTIEFRGLQAKLTNVRMNNTVSYFVDLKIDDYKFDDLNENNSGSKVFNILRSYIKDIDKQLLNCNRREISLKEDIADAEKVLEHKYESEEKLQEAIAKHNIVRRVLMTKGAELTPDLQLVFKKHLEVRKQDLINAGFGEELEDIYNDIASLDVRPDFIRKADDLLVEKLSDASHDDKKALVKMALMNPDRATSSIAASFIAEITGGEVALVNEVVDEIEYSVVDISEEQKSLVQARINMITAFGDKIGAQSKIDEFDDEEFSPLAHEEEINNSFVFH